MAAAAVVTVGGLEPRDLLDLSNAMEGKPAGSGWSYSNTNYVVAGLIAQRVTGRPFNEVVTSRVIERIGLRDTYAPEFGEEGIRGDQGPVLRGPGVAGLRVDSEAGVRSG
jgi:CubicO group peptidase (beta-lactamase class C family)